MAGYAPPLIGQCVAENRKLHGKSRDLTRQCTAGCIRSRLKPCDRRIDNVSRIGCHFLVVTHPKMRSRGKRRFAGASDISKFSDTVLRKIVYFRFWQIR